MRHLTNNDRNFGPFTVGEWHSSFSAYLDSGDEEDDFSSFLVAGFGWAVRVKLPFRFPVPFGKYREHSRRYGASLCDMGNGYDFFLLYYGPQTHDSSSTECWSAHIPWKQWRYVRTSFYAPNGDHFYTEPRGADFREYSDKKDQCPKTEFLFEDYDGESIVATCMIEEREWLKGTGWFKWLSRVYPPKIRRSLDIRFSSEVGPEKGSWKGGTLGHGIDMLPDETPESAFRRYCAKDHERKGRKYNLKFIGVRLPSTSTHEE